MRLICWHPLLTDHQAYTYLALDNRVERLRVHHWRTQDDIRAAQGWKRHSGPAGDEHAVPLDRWWSWSRAVLRSDPDAIHIFGSPFEDRRQIMVMLLACVLRRRVAIISEPYSVSDAGYFAASMGWKDRLKRQLRPLRYRGYGALVARRLDAVFAISPLACRQYAVMGVAPDRIAPFGYFVPPPPPGTPARQHRTGLRLAFVGSLIPRKGADVAIGAVASLRGDGVAVTLDLYGAGAPADAPAREGVRYCGILPFGGIAPTLRDYDALLVPSLFDGWAVVVNEAVQAGIPVIASDATGAGAFVAAQRCGEIVPAGDATALADCLRRWVDAPEQVAGMRAAAIRAALLLDPAVAADYMVRVLEARAQGVAVPASPWYPSLVAPA